MSTEIRKILQEIALSELGWDKPLPQGNLTEDLDSIQRLSLMVAIEDHYEIIFEPEDEAKIQTISDLITQIEEKVAHANAD